MTTPSGRSPRGRRDNGLDATEFAAAADVDPRVGEHLLDVLGLAGIAAYLQPSADLHPVTRTTTLPNRPTDRLFVDRQHLSEAREVIGRLDLGTDADAGAGPEVPASPEPGTAPAGAAAPADDSGSPSRRRRREDVDVDAAWREILASWEAPAVEPPVPGSRTRPAPAAPEPDDATPDRAGPDRAGSDRAPRDRADADRADADRAEADPAAPGLAPRDRADVDRAEPDRAEPDRARPDRARPDRAVADRDGPDGARADDGSAPPREERRRTPRDAVPRPITGLDVPFDPDQRVEDPDDEGFVPPAPPPVPPASRYTVLAVLLLLAGLAVFLRPSLLPIGESAALVLGVAGILGGFATLVWRLRDGLTDDDDGDDGAIV